MIRLPLSRRDITLRDPCGADEIALLAGGNPVSTALALLARLGGGQADWPGLAVTDFEFLLLSWRAARLGAVMALGFICPHCAGRAELSFRIPDLLAGLRPRVPAGVVADATRPGWYRVGAAGMRLPTAADLAAAQDAAMSAENPAALLAAACLDEAGQKPPHRAKLERLLGQMAPPLSRSLDAACPDCGTPTPVALSVARLVIAELRREAADLVADIDLIARAYHWPEAEILALPQARRRLYAARLRFTPGAAA